MTTFTRRSHEGWAVLVSGTVMVGLAMGAVFALGIFLKPIEEDLAWGRAQISAVALVTWSMLGLGSFCWGMLSDRFGIRSVVVGGGLQLGLGLVLSSQVSVPWQFYVAFGGVAGLAVGAFYVPLTATVTQWFQANRGLAVSLVSAGAGIGTFVVAPLIRWLITLYGWRTAMLLLGDVVWLIVVPLGFVVRNRVAPALDARPEADGTRSGPSLRLILQAPRFWLIALTHFLCCAAHSGPVFHMVAYAMDRGAGKMTAATIFGVSSLASVVGRVGSGMVADRYGSRWTLVALVGSAFSFYALGVLFGVAYGGVMPLYVLLTREYFGGRAMGGAYGGVFMLQAIGMGLGAYFGGWFYDHLGNSAWFFGAAGTIGAVAVLIAWALRGSGTAVLAAAASSNPA